MLKLGRKVEVVGFKVGGKLTCCGLGANSKRLSSHYQIGLTD